MTNHNASIINVLDAMSSCLDALRDTVQTDAHGEQVLRRTFHDLDLNLHALRQEIEQAEQEALLNNPVI